jgi:hypothetical protein
MPIEHPRKSSQALSGPSYRQEDDRGSADPHPRYKLTDLMAEMPQGLPRVEGWDEMHSVGLENG